MNESMIPKQTRTQLSSGLNPRTAPFSNRLTSKNVGRSQNFVFCKKNVKSSMELKKEAKIMKKLSFSIKNNLKFQLSSIT